MELAVEGEGAAFQRAVIDVQGDAGRGHVEGAPGGGGAPEAAVSDGGFDGDGAIAAAVVEAADGEQGAPGGHGAGVVMAALGLVPGVALFAIVAGAGVADALDALGGHAGVDHVRGGEVFEAGPGLGVVGERNARALGLAVIADDERGFVVEGVGALDGVVAR